MTSTCAISEISTKACSNINPELPPKISSSSQTGGARRSQPKKSSPDQEIAYSEGEVYLLTDKGERKVTGSYYTPDYIVRYIVENTLAPLCEDKSVDEILSLKILDPATGSGHFLVGVVDYLGRRTDHTPGRATHDRNSER